MHDTFMSYFQSETSDQAGEEQSPLLPPNQNEQHAPQNTVSESIGQEQQPPPAPPPAPVQAQPPSLPNPPPPAAPVPQYPQPAAPTQGQDQNAPLYGGSSSNRSTLNEIEQVDVTGQGQEEGRPMDTFSNVARNLTHELNQLSPQDQAHATNMLQDPEFLKNLLQFGSPGSQNDDEANPHIRRPLVDLLVSSANAIIADVRQEIDAYLCTEEFHQTLEGRIDEVFTNYLLDPSITTNMVSLLVQRPEFTDRLDLIVESIVQRSLARNQPDPPPPESVANASSARKKGKTKVEQSPPLASWLQDLKTAHDEGRLVIPPSLKGDDSPPPPSRQSRRHRSSRHARNSPSPPQPPSSSSSSSSNSPIRSKKSLSQRSRQTGTSSRHDDRDKKDKDDHSDLESEDERRYAEKLAKYAETAGLAEQEDEMEPLKPTNDLFQDAVNYQTYRLKNRSLYYSGRLAGKIHKYQKRTDVRMGKKTFNGSDPVAIINFLINFRAACDAADAHEGVALWLFQFYLSGSAKSTVEKKIRERAPTEEQRRLDRRNKIVTTYIGAVQLLLETYATEDVLAEAHLDVTNFKQSDQMDEVKYAIKLSTKADRCGSVYPDRLLKDIFINGIALSIQDNVRGYAANHPKLDLYGLARYAKSIANLNRKAITPNRGSSQHGDSSGKTDSRKGRKGRGRRQEESLKDSESSKKTSTRGQSEKEQVVPLDNYDEVLAAQPVPQNMPSGRAGAFHTCRVCLANDHPTPKCKYLKDDYGEELARVREANYQAILRRRQSLMGQRSTSNRSRVSDRAGSSSAHRSVAATQDQSDDETESMTEN